jgi:hypothetical protein
MEDAEYCLGTVTIVSRQDLPLLAIIVDVSHGS